MADIEFGLGLYELNGILGPGCGPETRLLETDLACAVLGRVADAIYANNQKIAQDLVNAGAITLKPK